MRRNTGAFVLRFCFCLTGVLPLFAAPRPNIVYFYVDDMGWGGIGPNGQDARRAAGLPSVKTPNIDSLAEAGINFQRAYGCTVCSPARSSLMTGFHQGHTWADRNDPDNAKKAMRANDVTIADALKAAGYVSGYWGKWGFGASQDRSTPVILNLQTLPTQHGFDDVLAELHHVRAHSFFQPTLWSFQSGDAGLSLIPNNVASYTNSTDYPQYPAYPSHPNYPSTAYCDDYYMLRALDFVRAQAQRNRADGTPFFACLSPQIPHAPYADVATLPEWDAAYSGDPLFASLSAEAKQWAAMVTRIDAHFGNILAALEDPDNDGDTSDSVAENTLVIFQSDNGGANNAALSELGANGYLRSFKGSIWEGGIRIPLVMRWPAMVNSHSVVRPGTNTQKVIDATDILPTFCELAGVEAPLGVDGVSLTSFLTGQEGGRARDFLIHEAQPDRSIIKGDTKLVDDNGVLRLYDLAADPDESDNIAAANPTLVAELSDLLYGERVAEPQWNANTYHEWIGPDGGAMSSAANWSDYVYSNQVNGIVYDSDAGAPRVTWVARMHNSGASKQETVAYIDTDFLALEVAGTSATAVQALVISNCTVSGRNEVRLKPFSRVRLIHGALRSLRWVELQTNAVVEGSGAIGATLYHAGRLVVDGVDATVSGAGSVSTNVLLSNGGFEYGTGTDFNSTDEWFNSAPNQGISTRNTINPLSGSYRGIVGNGANGLISPTVDTGHSIQSNDTFTLAFHHAGAANWDLGADTITATLYYNDAGEQVIGSMTVTPSQGFAGGYDVAAQTFGVTASASGQTLLLRFESDTAAASGEFASIDDIELTVAGSGSPGTTSPASREIAIGGDYRCEPGAELDVTLAGVATQGVDYACVSVDGNAVLAGGLVVTVDPGFSPKPGDSFEVLKASSIAGRFSNAGSRVKGNDGTVFSIGYSSDAVTLTALAPRRATLLLVE